MGLVRRLAVGNKAEGLEGHLTLIVEVGPDLDLGGGLIELVVHTQLDLIRFPRPDWLDTLDLVCLVVRYLYSFFFIFCLIMISLITSS